MESKYSGWRKGDYWVISDDSGQKFLRSQCRFTWDGRLVHALTEFEPRQPQDTIKPRQDPIAVENPRPRQPTKFLRPSRDDL